MRGSPDVAWGPQCRRGSIPACAGEPLTCLAQDEQSRVYPRVCGGAGRSRRWPVDRSGLSPRVRGSLWRGHLPGPEHGSIPACAGEPRRCPQTGRFQGVYPRVCGGAQPRRPVLPLDLGLSPRVRGSRVWERGRRCLDGSIPACAGEPSPAPEGSYWGGVYPRVCGGASVKPIPPFIWAGLSPRVRGSPWRWHLTRGPAGSIPACAGEPGRATVRGGRERVYPRVCGGAPLRSRLG